MFKTYVPALYKVKSDDCKANHYLNQQLFDMLNVCKQKNMEENHG